MRTVLLMAVMLALVGCASSGTRIEPAQLDQVRKGQTTVADIVKRFGRPNFLSKNWDGTQTAAYANADGRSDSAALLPLMGAVVGGTGTDSVIFYFDASGVLTDYKTTQTAAAKAAQASVAEPAQTGFGAPAPAASNKPVSPRPAAPQRADGLPFWLPPSETRDPHQQ
jgi:outer membrane protein assembly factor BamE (lipoprotein component of BamABCDE complex)